MPLSIVLQEEDQVITFERTVPVKLPDPKNPRKTQQSQFKAVFIEYGMKEFEELRKDSEDDVEFVKGFVQSVDIDITNANGEKLSEEETLDFAANNRAINAALVKAYNKSRLDNLKS